MKKLFLISVLVCLAGLNQLFAANPIPSYNVLVSGKANFQETVKSKSAGPSKEKRQMNIETSTSTATPPPSTGMGRAVVVAMLYQLDGTATMGPFYIPIGQSLSVGIDGSPWGVNIGSADGVLVSVWTTN